VHPENKGKVYTGGLFRYAVHINYTGDVLWAAGFAAIAGNPWGWIVPIALFCFFKFFNAPMLDRHLSEHYGAEFDAYKSRTASMIPFLW
jgi:protein-S-isoprenylcysteine O-methyltransferase Ste14